MIEPLLERQKIIETARFIREAVQLGDLVVDYIHSLVENSRSHPQVFSGISTRGGLNLAAAAKAEAYLEGRDYVVPEDVQRIAVPVVAHRLILRPEFHTVRKEEVFRSLLAEIPVPMG